MTAVPDSPSSPTGSLPVAGGATSAADYAAAHAVAHAERPAAHGGRSAKGGHAWDILTTTDHKKLGIMYIVMSFLFFFAAGLMALFMRVELFHPGMQYLSNEQFNQMFTIHGTLMLLLFGTPIVWGFANAILPLQIGAPDVAFPRLNAFGFWITLFGGLMVLAGFLTPGGAADFAGRCTCRWRTPSTAPVSGRTSGSSEWG